MYITQIRNATLKIKYGKKIFLVDPMLSKKGEIPPFAPPHAPMPMSGNLESNPITELPMSVNEILEGVDALIVTHLHPDHWDPAASEQIDKQIPLFSQNEDDATTLREQGFKNVYVIGDKTHFEGISLTHTNGKHASVDEMLAISGPACGVVFKHESEKTVYLLGDTVWYDEVENNLQKYQPDVVIINAGNNQFEIGGPLIMGAEGVLKVHQTLPEAELFATHMEAVNHAYLTRKELKDFAKEHGFGAKLSVPEDGEKLEY
ncbi:MULTISPECIES: MBL fold metallo-hydrolase [Paenibacillus]|uniref:Metallo-beta-lactamase domain-containing protein n=1 Tax=Paenibacillus amylolyticus TaxID=1451 RepID=A0A1R1BEP2_PAEAM|nr:MULTISPECIES: MBL fold metallo-hydrolase [Paenibacillus]MBD8836935.1 MBL fold metallo-hydrolase [Paenibacillus sp. CFBP 13594]MCF7754046.1 MBL fold metallo-hydrolase [Paenibacillus xylanexedens]OMF04967.1 hypothetical protein BK131_29265 [Paenibacillus amylolyticus]PRA07807.1 MBL fold metallo-hydrolase [Paenibacillus sp. MYb63]PRA51451.1 MBL fold metallo-hydrolase [Paenibacillus sp. MYb67]